MVIPFLELTNRYSCHSLKLMSFWRLTNIHPQPLSSLHSLSKRRQGSRLAPPRLKQPKEQGPHERTRKDDGIYTAALSFFSKQSVILRRSLPMHIHKPYIIVNSCWLKSGHFLPLLMMFSFLPCPRKIKRGSELKNRNYSKSVFLHQQHW